MLDIPIQRRDKWFPPYGKARLAYTGIIILFVIVMVVPPVTLATKLR
jgi:hypothetical protein